MQKNCQYKRTLQFSLCVDVIHKLLFVHAADCIIHPKYAEYKFTRLTIKKQANVGYNNSNDSG